MFGAGLVGRDLLPLYKTFFNVLAVVDNDPQKRGTEIAGTPVIAATDIVTHDYDLLIVTSTSVGEIFDQLRALGVPETKLKRYNDPAFNVEKRYPWDAILFLLAVAFTVLAVPTYFVVKAVG
jgi:hypothetical protein